MDLIFDWIKLQMHLCHTCFCSAGRPVAAFSDISPGCVLWISGEATMRIFCFLPCLFPSSGGGFLSEAALWMENNSLLSFTPNPRLQPLPSHFLLSLSSTSSFLPCCSSNWWLEVCRKQGGGGGGGVDGGAESGGKWFAVYLWKCT